MIDWFRGSIPFKHYPLNSGEVFSVNPDGTIEWSIVKATKARGSHESNLNIKSYGSDGKGRATDLLIDGNISKYLQGHNLIGSRDLNDLILKTFTKLTDEIPQLNWKEYKNDIERKANLSLSADAEQSISSGHYDVKSIDINQLYRLENEQSVESWLYAAEMHASKRAGRTTSKRGTVYLGQTSRRWAIKFYAKYPEMLKNQNDSHPHYERLLGFAKGVLRVELRLLSLELKDKNLTKGYHFTEDRIAELFEEYTGRIQMTKNAILVDDQLLNLPPSVQATYHLWRTGVHCRGMLTKPTFFRHRKILLDHSIDINFPTNSPDRNNIIPLMRIVEAKPIANPDWAYHLHLIA